jgi:hypothetical protein
MRIELRVRIMDPGTAIGFGVSRAKSICSHLLGTTMRIWFVGLKLRSGIVDPVTAIPFWLTESG